MTGPVKSRLANVSTLMSGDLAGRLVRGAGEAVNRAIAEPDTLARLVAGRGGAGADTIRDRVRVLAEALGVQVDDNRATTQAVLDRLTDADLPTMWLALAVLRAELPTPSMVLRARRRVVLNGVVAAFREHLLPTNPFGRPANWGRQVQVSDAVLVDVEHTSRTGMATGIQRVTRESVRRWVADHEPTLVAWTRDLTALRPLTDAEREITLTGAARSTQVLDRPTVLIPQRGTYLLPELNGDKRCLERLMALAEFGRTRTGAIGFDCVPISAAETTNAGVSESFSWNLAALRYFDAIAGISEAAAQEYRGWRQMLGGIGLAGPQVAAIGLAITAPQPSEADTAAARREFAVGALPMLLCVGTHEPRKNHLAVLHAADLAWRAGHRFSLTFIGGDGWFAEPFYRRLAELQAQGRPVESRHGVPDQLLWGAYKVAHAVLLPSLSEGFGLPAAEALAIGTPVIVSGYGSLAEIGADGGALFVDPRDDASIADAITRILSEPGLRDGLAQQAAERSHVNWDDYAAATWAFLAEGRLDPDDTDPDRAA